MPLVSASEVKVGILVITAILFLVTLTVSIGNFQAFFSETITVHVKIPNVIGLEPYAQVTYAGVRIGTVNAIHYDETINMAVVDAVINRNSPVAVDSKGRFTSAGLLSPLFLEIYGGSQEKKIKTLLQKGEIKTDSIYLDADPYASIGDLFALAGDIKVVLGKVSVVLDGIQKPLGDVGGLIANVSQELKVILAEADQLLVQGRPKAVAVLDHANSLITDASAQVIPILNHIEKGTKQLPQITSQAGTKVNRVLDQANHLIAAASPEILQLTSDLQKTIQDLRERVNRVETNLSKVLKDTDRILTGNEDDLKKIITHLKLTSSNLEDLSGQLAKNPWRLVWKTEERKQPLKVSPDWDPFKKETPSRK